MRGVMLGRLVAASATLAPIVFVPSAMAAVSPPQSAIGNSGWISVQEPDTCKVARRFAGADTSLTIALQGNQMLSGPEILLIEEGKLSGMKATGSVGVAVLPGGSNEKVTYGVGIDLATGRRHIEISGRIGLPLLTGIERAATVQFSFDNRPPISIPATGMDAALSALRGCQRREAAARGVDVAGLDAVAVPARSIDLAPPAFGYPPEARRQNRMGDVEVVWTIDASGNSRDCRVVKSSGTKSLDDASCLAIVKGARFHSAQNRAGQPIAMQQWTRIKWRLNGASGLPLR